MAILYILTHLAHFKVFGNLIQCVELRASTLQLCQQYDLYHSLRDVH